MSWSADVPDPDAYLGPLFSGEGIGRTNFGRFTDPDLDHRLRTSARRAVGEQEGVLEYRRVEDLVCELMPMIPVVRAARSHVVRAATVTAAPGRAISLATGRPNLRELSVRTP
jgi:ABC-type oligopeptide transport system substrate-binding subunit